MPPLGQGWWLGGLQPDKTEGLFSIISLEFLKLLSTPQSSSLCSADSSPYAGVKVLAFLYYAKYTS